MYEVRQIIQRLRLGETDRSIARSQRVGRRKVAQIAKGASYTQAYRIAYPASLKYPARTVWSKGSTMAANGMVKERIAALRRSALEEAQYGVSQAMAETDAVLRLAIEERQLGPAAALLKHKAMLKGLLITKVETGGVGEFSKFDAHEKLEMVQALRETMAARKALAAPEDIEDVDPK